LAGAPPREKGEREAIFGLEDVGVSYSGNQAVRDISFDINVNEITALIGPSGCGKSTLIRCLNRMNDIIPGTRVEGQVLIDGQDIYAPASDVVALRRRVGMVFQKSNPFPKSIYENVAYGLRIQGINRRSVLDETVERSLRSAALWEEVKDRLHESALSMSGGQQQRLCIARTIAVRPEVILMDEPCSALDPIATARIEDLMQQLREDFTIIIVTHNMQQAARVADRTAFFTAKAAEGTGDRTGELVEYDLTAKLFSTPADKRTEDYISGRFG